MESCSRPADDSQQVREVRRTDWGARLRQASGRIWRPGQHRACTVLTLISQEKIMLRGCSKQGCWLGTHVHGTRLCPWVRPVARGYSARWMMTAPGSSSAGCATKMSGSITSWFGSMPLMRNYNAAVAFRVFSPSELEVAVLM